MGDARSFEDVFDAREAALQRLLPGGQRLDVQRPVLGAWYEHLDDEDVAWCVGEAAGAYGLLAAERLGSERVVGSLAVAGLLSVLAGVFELLATVLELLARSPFRRLSGRALVGLVIAGLFVLFLVVATVLAALAKPIGGSEQAAGAVAGALVLAIPVLGALFFLKLAIEG